MEYFGDSDIPTLLRDFGRPVTIGEFEGVGIADIPEEMFDESDPVPGRGGVNVKLTKLFIQTSAWPDVRIDSPVFWDGTSYSVRSRLPYGDGAMTEIELGAPRFPNTDAPIRVIEEPEIDGGNF